MNTYLDCIPCFFRQMLEGARVINAGPKAKKQLIDDFARLIPKLSLSSSPPEIARHGYALLKKINHSQDPYKGIKQKSNCIALRLYPKLKNKVRHSKDRLLTALELSIAGNIIDFGAKNNLNVHAELRKILAKENKSVLNKSIFHYSDFIRGLKKAKNILYLADNAGEVVFDRVLIEQLRRIYPGRVIYYAVKGKPVINDALAEDARKCGVQRVAQIISNGNDAPGTVLALCSKEFRGIYKSVDMVISKGQGNFETLSRNRRPIFFLFMVKCPVVAEETGCAIGDIVLIHNLRRKRKS